ncbi:reticulon-4-interacting protein 1 homolog, mitochondrial [Phlebotomus argentipes]|uniref:reticulon-4-interacting protein 1 homolog, mitochondrial n=1 Tax=Phlebotomus argentipes TaxID=94469 RepID=UPI002892A21D|nr:reticulon-4-interacting protein 1 homolog, mitochondrial [Phlebotomus argentipes]
MNICTKALSRFWWRNGPKLLKRELEREQFVRPFSQSAVKEEKGDKEKPGFPHKMKMRGWQIHSYGDLDEVQFSDNIRIPQVKTGSEVMVRIKAASVNPIDIALIGGYGATLLNLMRRTDIEFPLTLGRDFVGEIVYRGLGVPRDLRIGDIVWGVIPPHKQGCHSQYAVIDSSLITHKPRLLSDIEACGILYSGLTAWSGLFLSGGLGNLCASLQRTTSSNRKRVLILGGSGGVGTMAVQIAKSENVHVFATGARDSADMLSTLGADCVLDYGDVDFLQHIHSNGPYDIILDCAGSGPNFASKIQCDFGSYVTFSSPLLRNIDSHGLISGNVRNAMSLLEDNSRGRGLVKWGYFVPLQRGMEHLKRLVEQEKLRCVVDSVYGFDNAIGAYQRVKDGHLRGKVVLDLS